VDSLVAKTLPTGLSFQSDLELSAARSIFTLLAILPATALREPRWRLMWRRWRSIFCAAVCLIEYFFLARRAT
jgi:hypothetical protein